MKNVKREREETEKVENEIEDHDDPSYLPVIMQVFNNEDHLEEPNRIVLMYLVPNDIENLTCGVIEDG